MKVSETLFDKCLVIETNVRKDERGTMELLYKSDCEFEQILDGFNLTEQRIYKMQKNVFFGIHRGPSKLISVIQGKGLDYIIDLREDSKTFKQYRTIELSEDNPRLIYVPAGFGHAFLSLSDNTIQAFAQDLKSVEGKTSPVNYQSPGINLELPVKDIIMADYDRNAENLI
ncbi:MAG: dTDP-4-dehydrorhamnose 3,5-epimerase family protein [Lachnospiraceae bacterium]|nr:dTDP-4-dehydrorhamnose 3,5-epimerase family protein [Lachnospiraceae bacterium]